MKRTHRLIAWLLALVMTASLCLEGLPARAATAGDTARQEVPTGSIRLTIRFDLPQTVTSAAARNIRLQVTGGGGETVVSLPNEKPETNTLHAAVSVSVRNEDGAELNTERRVGYYQVELDHLPAGGTGYVLALTGTGYVPFQQTVTLGDYSRHVIVGTGDGTFSLGDLNGDGSVDGRDLTLMDEALANPSGGDAGEYDLNGDGRLDVTDLAYVNYTLGVTREAQVKETAAIVSPAVDTAKLNVTDGTLLDLFREEGTVTLTPNQGPLAIPIDLNKGEAGVEMERVQITCPDGDGAIQAGTAQVVLADGSTMEIPFDTAAPAGVHTIGETVGQRVVTIDLGKRVAVKKVTITVTAAAGGAGYATVTRIEFLKDIVPDNPKNDAAQVKGLTATAGDGQVSLEWSPVRNVTGYEVRYGLDQDSLQQTVLVNTNRAVVTGLENTKPYYFQVTAVNGGWRGDPSEVVSAMPEPGRAPGAPSNLGVISMDRALRLSWGKTKDAVYYQVFYREAGQSAFTRFGGNITGTSATITGLTNGTLYELAVKAGNSRGTGPYSATAEGTPKKEVIALPDLPADGRISAGIIDSIVMTDPNNVNRTLCPGFAVADVIDNDAATYWIARNWSYNSHFTYTFREPQDMNYFILVPYLGGNYKYALNTYTVTAKDSQGNVLLAETLYAAPRMNAERNYLVLPFAPVKGVKSLSISLNEREGNGCRVSISEIAFYKSDPLADDIAALFTDDTFTAVKDGVKAETIDALSARLKAKADFYLDLDRLEDELELARALLESQSDALGLVKNDFQSRSAAKDSQYGQSASALQPLGVSAKAGATVAVYAQLPDDAPVYVTPTQFFGESGVWSGGAIPLTSGRNYIQVPKIGALTDERGGPLYLSYAGDHPEQIRLHVRGGQDVSFIPVLELSGWYDMTETARRDAIRTYVEALSAYVPALTGDLTINTRNATEISTPSVLLSIPADRALAALKGVGNDTEAMVTAMYQNVLAWEQELFVCNKVQGIIPSDAAFDGYRYPMTTRQNIRYMRMFAGAFMYAAGAHIGVGYGSTGGLVSGRPASQTQTGLFGWGISHEIGHNMDKLGRAEITNNIYALAAQAWNGGDMTVNTRLTNSNIWKGIFDKVSVGRPGAASSVFIQLGMYWQLHLAYDGADEPLAFFNAFFKAWKAGEYKEGYTYDERVALVASKVANQNLTDFFTRWGLTLGEGAKEALSKYPAETRAIWYLNDTARTYRLGGGTGNRGVSNLTTEVKDSKVTLTIQSETPAAILGYEIRRNGTAIGFTTGNTYTDDLGAANNLTYRYSVVPVDYLGALGTEVRAPEVRVAWDTAIPAGKYTASTDGGTVTFTMKSGSVPVTGIKVTGTGLTGEYAVQLKATAGDAGWTTAKTGTLSGSEVVAYFTKPGAAADDTRIWTYDAAVLQVTGIPEGAIVTPLDYPGNRLDFQTGAAVGRLSENVRYGDKEDQVISKDTLVILGTYRGDPVYNTVEIQARYSTTPEGNEEATTKERPMNGYSLLFAELPEDGEVSDISDGFWLFVPDLEAEKALNQADGVTTNAPDEIRAVLYRTDDPYGASRPDGGVNRRITSQTLWISFPDSAGLPLVTLNGAQEGGRG